MISSFDSDIPVMNARPALLASLLVTAAHADHGNLADFNETDPNGDWSVCVGDAAPADAGDLELVTLSILAY